MWRGNIQENILYEDSQILVCHKPAGLAVQNAKWEAWIWKVR